MTADDIVTLLFFGPLITAAWVIFIGVLIDSVRGVWRRRK